MAVSGPSERVALSIAGSDSGGGAGVQADLLAFAALGVHGTCAVTALTAQSTRGVAGILAVPPEFVRAQIDAVLGDFAVGAVKLGMLGSAANVRAVAAALAGHAAPVVLDPVLVASDGTELLPAGDVAALREHAFPLATLITPNLPEAARLLATSEARVLAAPEEACRGLAAMGPRGTSVLLKGGHAPGAECIDWLWHADELRRFAAPRVDTPNTHGTGCTLSAAIAAGLALGAPLPAAVERAKAFVTAALRAGAGRRLGGGPGPLRPIGP
jgi:hydroxymethylpyrimidine/phosphomethylpyrimidine kinase